MRAPTAAGVRPPDTPLPAGFCIEFDRDAREIHPGVWFGGRPARVLTFTPAGRAALRRLRNQPVLDRVDGLVARRLTDVGIAHPVPPPVETPDVTVIIPVLDRTDALDRCLTSLGGSHPVLVVDDGSRDELRVRAVCARHGVTVVRHPVNRGPATARNTGLARTTTSLVAFVDSDTEPGPDAITALAGHLLDPDLAAVAPRVVPVAGSSAASRYTSARSSLDLGTRPARVLPYTPVSYVPTAALLVRRSALPAMAFDPSLRVGEDVDLIWRLVASGARVRFDPATAVSHHDPRTWTTLLHRRFRYGTSAAALANRHAGNVAPLVLHPWPTAAVVAGLAGWPLPAAVAAAVAYARTRAALQRANVPTDLAVPLTATALGYTLLGLSRYAVQFAAPALFASAVRGGPRSRAATAALLLAPAVVAWRNRRAEIGPLTFAVGALADDIAYGAGVVAGCVTHRTTLPLRPVLAPPRAG
ncbi:MAG: mycofactocin biosynthesis glycosyltransferase MftF [Jatrophihabitans sp.]